MNQQLKPSSEGVNILFEMFSRITPETASISRKDNAKRPLANPQRDRSNNSRSNFGSEQAEPSNFKTDLARKVFYEKRELEDRYKILSSEYEKMKEKYERMKKEFIKLKEKSKGPSGREREQDTKSYRPTADDDENYYTFDEGERTHRSSQPPV